MTIKVLCLVGSTTTREMSELSELYTRGCLSALGEIDRYDFSVLHRSPDGAWRLSDSLERLDSAQVMNFAEAVAVVSDQAFDIAVPQMFCQQGMTAGRALFELLDIPFIGNTPIAMGMTADKALARCLVAASGVRVPEGRVLREGETATDLPALPLIVKPVSSDNSEGLSLVRAEAELPHALERSHAEGDALVEQFIAPGRELRCGVIERDGDLICLPPEEYPVGQDRPIRTKTDKLVRPGGKLTLAAKTKDGAWIIDDTDPVIPALFDAARKAYRALGCRHYGLFDFRVDDEGQVWFLEAGLYCSFSAQSVISMMAEAGGIPLSELFDGYVADLLGEGQSMSTPSPVDTPTAKAPEELAIA